MTHGSLFSGIGGFELAARWMGWQNVFSVEKDPYCNKVLERHYPETQKYGDIYKFDARPWQGSVDIISGGFPCQPFSQAGRRRGTADDRYLWPEMLRVIREASPRYVVAENVRGLLTQDGGVVFEQVCAGLEAAGYEVLPLILPAAGVGAPHRRDRIWIIAHSNVARVQECNISKVSAKQGQSGGGIFEGVAPHATGHQADGYRPGGLYPQPAGADEQGPAAYATRQRHECSRCAWPGRARPADKGAIPHWRHFPTSEPAVRRGDDGIPNRVHRLRALGNAIVPQVAYQLFQAIQAVENVGHAKI